MRNVILTALFLLLAVTRCVAPPDEVQPIEPQYNPECFVSVIDGDKIQVNMREDCICVLLEWAHDFYEMNKQNEEMCS